MRDKLGRFVKGHAVPMEYRIKNSIAHKGKVSPTKGKKLSPEHIEKLRISHIGQKQSKESIEKRANSNRGKKRSLQFRMNQSLSKMGSKNPSWRGGISYLNNRMSPDITDKHRKWRKAVFERDNYTCQECGIKGGKLCADHIKPYALFPDLRWILENGQTLCRKCHAEKTRDELKIYWKNQFGVSKYHLDQQAFDSNQGEVPYFSNK